LECEAANVHDVRRGIFITFEGGEGAGKSTQVRRLAERLSASGREVVTTREPGGSNGAEAIRALLVQGDADRWSALSETLLLYAARADHLERLIRPALARGAIVICDRFADSTRAYQGAAGGVDPAFIDRIEHEVLGATRPDLTLILDLPAAAGLARAAGRGGAEARFESKGLVFHQRLRDGFLSVAAAEPERCVVVDADKPIDGVSNAIAEIVAGLLRRDGETAA
jgi:dTMP kinase